MNLNNEALKLSCAFELIKNESAPIKIHAGKIQISNVIIERKKPPRL